MVEQDETTLHSNQANSPPPPRSRSGQALPRAAQPRRSARMQDVMMHPQTAKKERVNTGIIHPSYPTVQQQVRRSAAKAPAAVSAKATARRIHAPAPRWRARQGGSIKKQKQAAITANSGGITPQNSLKSPSSVCPTLNHQKRAQAHTASGRNTKAPTPAGGRQRQKQERQEAMGGW